MANRSTLRLPGAMVLGGDWDIGMGVREFGEALAGSLSGRRRPWQFIGCQLQLAAAYQHVVKSLHDIGAGRYFEKHPVGQRVDQPVVGQI